MAKEDHVSARVSKETKQYIEDLTIALRRSESYIVDELLQKAIEYHKKGEFEL